MREMRTKLSLALLALGGLTLAWAAEPAQGLTLTDTPAAVQKTIRGQIGKGTVAHIDKISDDDGTTYAVEGAKPNGTGKVFTVAEDGTLESIEVALEETPDPVQTTIKSQLGANQLEGIDKTMDERVVKYVVEMTVKDGTDRSFVVAPDGTLESIEMVLGEVPAAVQGVIKTRLGGGTLQGIDKTFDLDEVAYDVSMTTRSGQDRDFTVGANGTLQSMDVGLGETPAPVQDAIKAQMGQGQLKSIDQVFDPEGTRYDVEMTTKDGQARHFTLTPTGKLASLEVALEETSAAVQATIAKEAAQLKIESIDKNFEPDGNTYDVATVSRAGRERDFTVTESGDLLTREVFLENIPAPAQKTIREQIGTGRILRIDRSTERDSGVLPFVVQGRKNGQPFNFSVGPGGRFLGMDP